ncbi:MBL fold metallo-hydrolase [Candidatus Woesearchaeota archaeon]|nr:MBL fold metallo-hydrolase [Candidatus Woesearchaeota archaeon]
MPLLTFLGTGHGMPKRSSCSSIFIEDSEASSVNLLLDTGGGHDILCQFAKAEKDPCIVQNIFISHYDSDHILGIVPLMRAFSRGSPKERRIFCSAEVKRAIDSLFLYVAKKRYDDVKQHLQFVIIKDRMDYGLQRWKLTFFDVKSTGTPQFGCKILFSDKKKLSFLGDEPLQDHYLPIVKESDILIHNAFCLEKDKETFKPKEKGHSTVQEAAQNAEKAHARHLVLFHMEDDTLKTRKKEYLAEVKKYFSGEATVPVDGDTLVIS